MSKKARSSYAERHEPARSGARKREPVARSLPNGEVGNRGALASSASGGLEGLGNAARLRRLIAPPASADERAADAFAARCATCSGPTPCTSCAGAAPRPRPAAQAPAELTPGVGSPLPRSLRSEFEGRVYGHLADVQVHTGDGAARAAASLGARAYTVGRHIVFGRGQFAPNTSVGRQLLAHEIAHTLQGGNAIRRQLDAGVPEVDPVAGVATGNELGTPRPAPPPSYDYYPCNIATDDMTNDVLRSHLSRVLRVVERGSGASGFNDNLHALRRLTPFRQRRVRNGEVWLAGDVHESPSFLYRIRPDLLRAGFVEIVSEPLSDALGPARVLAGATVLTEAQLRAYLRGARIPDYRIQATIRAIQRGRSSAELDLATAVELNRREDQQRIAPLRQALGLGGPPMLGPRSTLPSGASMLGPRATLPSVAPIPGGVRAPPISGGTSRSIWSTMGDLLRSNQGLWSRYFGGIGEGSAQARFRGALDLDTLRPTRNFPDYDLAVPRSRDQLLSVKTQRSSRPYGGAIGALERGWVHIADPSERPAHIQRLGEISRLLGENISPQQAIQRNRLLVNEDNVESTRLAVRDDLLNNGMHDALMEAVVDGHEVTRADGTRYTTSDLQADLAREPVGFPPDEVRQKIADIASRQVMSHGLTTEQVNRAWGVILGHLRNVNPSGGQPTGAQIRQAVRRLTPIEIEVAIRPGRATAGGAGMSIASAAIASLLTNGFRALFGGEVSWRDEGRNLAIGLPAAGASGALDVLARGRLPSSRLGSVLSPRATGFGVGVGGAAIAAPVTTMLMMGLDPSHEFSSRDYAAAAGRSVVPAVVSATIVEAMMGGATLGAAGGTATAPGPGTLGGAAIGLGLGMVTYMLTDALIGDQIEGALLRWIGEPSGCGQPPPAADD